MKILHQLSSWIYNIEKVMVMILGAVMLISLSAGVLFRYLLNSPLTWSDETAIFALVWLTFLGGSMSIKRQDSAAVTIIMDKLTGKTRQLLIGAGLAVLLAFVVYIFYLSIGWLSSPSISIQRSNSMGLPMIIPYLSVPVSFLFLVVHTLELLVNNFIADKGGNAA